jgi:hypothetical protein
MITNLANLLLPIRQLHERIRDRLVAATESTSPDELTQIAKEETGPPTFILATRLLSVRMASSMVFMKPRMLCPYP